MHVESTQYGYTLYAFFFSTIFITGFLILDSQNVILFSWPALLVFMLLLFILWFFYKLSVRVDEDFVEFSFGPGFFGRKYKIEDIEQCNIVRNKWWHGWGIRLLPNFTIYNVSGFDAIELKFKHSKRKVRIGVKNPSDIASIINHNIRLRQ